MVSVRKIDNRILKTKVYKERYCILSALPHKVVWTRRLINKQFQNTLDELVRKIALTNKIFLDRDLNKQGGKDSCRYERIHGGQNFENKNDMGETALNFAQNFVSADDLKLINTLFKKQKEHLVTFERQKIGLKYTTL